MHKNYYKILGIEKSSSTEEVKKSFRKIAFRLHPDKSADSKSAEKFITAYEAYSVLSDSNLRQQYDESVIGKASINFKDKLNKIHSKGADYASNFKKFKWDFYLFFVLDMIIGYRRLSLASVALITIGIWSLYDGAMKFQTPIFLIGLGLLLFGLLFMTIAIRKFQTDWEEDIS